MATANELCLHLLCNADFATVAKVFYRYNPPGKEIADI
jgi:hypothetical protein